MYSILIVDDEKDVLDVRAKFLEQKHCSVDVASTASSALILLAKNNYDGILLDLVMPDLSGFDLCHEVKLLSDAPIIFLSCHDDTENQITGFNAGAADFIPKDCPLELFWKKVEFRITSSKLPERNFNISFPPLEINLKNHNVVLEGKIIQLTSIEFNLLVILAENPGKVCSIEYLYKELWQDSSSFESGNQVVQNHISRMRRKLEKAFPHHEFVETVWRKGYKFVPNN